MKGPLLNLLLSSVSIRVIVTVTGRSLNFSKNTNSGYVAALGA